MPVVFPSCQCLKEIVQALPPQLLRELNENQKTSDN